METEFDPFSRYAMWKIMEWFTQHPGSMQYVNGLSKETGLSNATCSRLLNELEEKSILRRKELGRAHYYEFNENYIAREVKRFILLYRLNEAGLVERLVEENPSLTNLVLYGSCATGEYEEGSDLDLLAIVNGKIRLDLHQYCEKLGREIHIASINIGKWISMKNENEGFYQEVKRSGICLIGEELL